jgi:hypothetical protein
MLYPRGTYKIDLRIGFFSIAIYQVITSSFLVVLESKRLHLDQNEIFYHMIMSYYIIFVILSTYIYSQNSARKTRFVGD